jgi:hypothetical protein
VVTVPELVAQDDAHDRAPHEPREPDAAREIEPDDRVGRLDDEVAELAAVRPVDDPRVSLHDRLDPAAELGRLELLPAGLMVDRVELVERHPERRCERPTDRRLPAAAGSGDDCDAPHHEADCLARGKVARCA